MLQPMMTLKMIYYFIHFQMNKWQNYDEDI